MKHRRQQITSIAIVFLIYLIAFWRLIQWLLISKRFGKTFNTRTSCCLKCSASTKYQLQMFVWMIVPSSLCYYEVQMVLFQSLSNENETHETQTQNFQQSSTCAVNRQYKTASNFLPDR